MLLLISSFPAPKLKLCWNVIERTLRSLSHTWLKWSVTSHIVSWRWMGLQLLCQGQWGLYPALKPRGPGAVSATILLQVLLAPSGVSSPTIAVTPTLRSAALVSGLLELFSICFSHCTHHMPQTIRKYDIELSFLGIEKFFLQTNLITYFYLLVDSFR